jgi:hypothetical protein
MGFPLFALLFWPLRSLWLEVGAAKPGDDGQCAAFSDEQS